MLDYTIHDYRGIPGNTYRFTEQANSEDFKKAREIEKNIKSKAGPLKEGFCKPLNLTIHSFS